MLTMYKPWIKNVDDFLDKSNEFSINKKDSCSSHLSNYMSDKEFLKAIMMKIHRAKIALCFYHTVETNIGIIHEYSPTLNRKNEAMAGVDEMDCEPNGT